GRGVFMLTKGMTSTIPWLESIAAGSGRPVMIAAMFVDPGDPTRVFRELDEIGAARGRGRELWAQVGCFPLGMEFTLRHPYPLEAFLAWRPAIEAADGAAYERVLADPSFRKRIKDEAAMPGVPNRFSNKTWPHLRILEVTRPEHAGLVGRSVTDLAREAGRAPLAFDPKTVGRGPKRRVHDLPTGASRLDTPAVGVHGVWVNGVRTVDERGVIAACGRPGRLLRRFAA